MLQKYSLEDDDSSWYSSKHMVEDNMFGEYYKVEDVDPIIKEQLNDSCIGCINENEDDEYICLDCKRIAYDRYKSVDN